MVYALDRNELWDFAESEGFNLEAIGNKLGLTRERVRQILNEKFGWSKVDKARKRFRKIKKDQKEFEAKDHKHNKMFQNILSKGDRVPYWSIYTLDPYYLDTCAALLKARLAENFDLQLTQEDAAFYIESKLRTLFYNSFDRQKSQPDYWMTMTPLQFTVITCSSPDLEDVVKVITGKSKKSAFDMSRLDHAKGKSILNCAFQTPTLNRCEGITRTHLASKIEQQNAWSQGLRVLSETNPLEFERVFASSKKQAVRDVGFDNFMKYSKELVELDVIDLVSMILHRPYKNRKFKRKHFHVGRLDHAIGYTRSNVALQDARSNIRESRARNGVVSSIRNNLVSLAHLLASDERLQQLEYFVSIHVWLVNAARYAPEALQASYNLIADMRDDLFAVLQEPDSLLPSQRDTIRNFLCIDEGLNPFYDLRVASHISPLSTKTLSSAYVPKNDFLDFHMDSSEVNNLDYHVEELMEWLNYNYVVCDSETHYLISNIKKMFRGGVKISEVVDFMLA